MIRLEILSLFMHNRFIQKKNSVFYTTQHCGIHLFVSLRLIYTYCERFKVEIFKFLATLRLEILSMFIYNRFIRSFQYFLYYATLWYIFICKFKGILHLL